MFITVLEACFRQCTSTTERWNGAGSGRRTSLTPKLKVRNNPKSFSDDEVAVPEWPGNQGM